MEVQTAMASEATGSKTIADLLPLAARKRPDEPALRYKDLARGEWVDVSYAELAETAKQLSLGLQAIGIEARDKLAILSNTRPEWTYFDFAILSAGATVVPIYQTNSPEECEYVLGHSESRGIVVEDSEQLEKIREVRDRLPRLEHVITIESLDTSDAMSLDELRDRGRERPDEDFTGRVSEVGPTDVATYIYTSGTTGPPKGCVIDHENWRSMLDMVEVENVVSPGSVTYLFLPLAHAFARLIELGSIDVGGTLVYWERDPQKIIPNLMEVKPTYFPSVPRIFEKIYALSTANAPDKEKLAQAVQVGMKVRELQRNGKPVPPDLQEAYEEADEALFKNVRNLFGDQIEQCVTGAAPIAKEILEFFYACGVHVLEGYGMTETSTASTVNHPDDFKFGSVGKPFPGCEIKIADDGEVLIKGPNIFRGYYKNDEATKETVVGGWLHTGDLGRLDEDGFLYITGRKKDIIITAGGKNITPANLENWLKQNQYISQAVVYGDRRPYLTAIITLDPEEIFPWAEQHDLEKDMTKLAQSEQVRALVQEALDEVNTKVARVEQVKRFTILDHDLSQETGELTPTLKVKRNVVYEKYAPVFDALYK